MVTIGGQQIPIRVLVFGGIILIGIILSTIFPDEYDPMNPFSSM